MHEGERWKPVKGWLVKLEERIPRNRVGDPAFEELGVWWNSMVGQQGEWAQSSLPLDPKCVLAVFTSEQVTYMVNKYLYSQTYQRDTHRKRAQEERDLLAPLKEKFKEVYGGSWAKATEEQIDEVVRLVREERLKGKENEARSEALKQPPKPKEEQSL